MSFLCGVVGQSHHYNMKDNRDFSHRCRHVKNKGRSHPAEVLWAYFAGWRPCGKPTTCWRDYKCNLASVQPEDPKNRVFVLLTLLPPCLRSESNMDGATVCYLGEQETERTGKIHVCIWKLLYCFSIFLWFRVSISVPLLPLSVSQVFSTPQSSVKNMIFEQKKLTRCDNTDDLVWGHFVHFYQLNRLPAWEMMKHKHLS